MKKAFAVLGVLALLALGLAVPASAQSRLGFKIGGGLAYLGGGDLNKGLQGMSDLLGDIYTLGGVTVGGGYSPVHLGMDLAGEIIFQITPNMGIGLGAGYFSASKASEMTLTTPTDSATMNWKPQAGVIPITLNFHYSIPAGGSLKFNIHAGVGYYLATLKHTQHIILIFELDDEYDLSGSGFGAHGGVGLEIALSPNVGFTFDILGRFASLGPFKGDRTYSVGMGTNTETGGTLWYEDVTMGTLGTYPYLAYDADAPGGSGISGVHEAKLDLSGFSAVAGFIFRF